MLCSSLTLTLWTTCVLVGALGLFWPHARPKTPVQEYPVIHTEILQVELEDVPLHVALAAAPSPAPAALEMPPAKPKPRFISPAPAFMAVAPPVDAFALPAEAPAEEARLRSEQPEPSHPQRLTNPAPPERSRWQEEAAHSDAAKGPEQHPAQTLTLGLGDGRQAAPIYPAAAVRAGQEGTVRIRFEVDETGSVRNASVSAPSPWPLLNESALRTVSRLWRFAPGSKRLYEAPIHFRLNK